MTMSTPLTVRSLMAKQSYPGPKNLNAGGAYVCNGSSNGSGGSHGCISPGSLLLSSGCPLHLQRTNPISTHLLPDGTVSSNILHVLGSDLILLQGVLHLIASSAPQLNVDHDVSGHLTLCGAVDILITCPNYCNWHWVIMASIILQLVFLIISV